MVGQLALEEYFDDLLTYFPHESVKMGQGFDILFLEQLLQFVPVKCQWNLLDSLFKEVYAISLILRENNIQIPIIFHPVNPYASPNSGPFFYI
jgi:hypothetical protein